MSFSENQKTFRQAGISGAENLHLDRSRRRDKTLWINEDSSVQSDYLNFANGLKNYLNQEPKASTLVVFLSDKFFHKVLPAKQKRYSITGWFRVDR